MEVGKLIENLNKFYSSITMEENPSKVIKKEITKERLAKLKDKKQIVKNAAIGTIIATSYHINSVGTIASVFLYDQMYKYVEIRKQTGTATQSTLLGKMLESKLGKFVDSKIDSMKAVEETLDELLKPEKSNNTQSNANQKQLRPEVVD